MACAAGAEPWPREAILLVETVVGDAGAGWHARGRACCREELPFHPIWLPTFGEDPAQIQAMGEGCLTLGHSLIDGGKGTRCTDYSSTSE